MPKSIAKLIAITLTFSAGSAAQVLAQDRSQDTSITAEQLAQTPSKPRIIRKVEPIPYWVEADQLRVRDNPYAGDVVGMLEIGQKVKVHKTVDSWVLISADGKPEKWVNRNFLSTSPVTWANYNFSSRGARNLRDNRFGDARYDIKKKRIKIKGVKDVRVYAADIKRLAAGKKLVISRHDYRAGPYFEKRLVQCSDTAATHVKILGEGYTVMMMEADPRMDRIGTPMAVEDQVGNEELSSVDKAIADFTCETEKL